MTELAAVLFGFYIVFKRRWLWSAFVGASDAERYAFGALCYAVSLVIWWWSVG